MPDGTFENAVAASPHPLLSTATVANGVASAEFQRSCSVPCPEARAVTPVMPARFTGSHARWSPGSSEVTLRRPLAESSEVISAPSTTSAHSASCGFGLRTSEVVVVAAGTPLAPASV